MSFVKETDDITAIKHFQTNNDRLLMKQLLLGMEFFSDPYVRKIVDLRSPMKMPKYEAGKGWRTLDTRVVVSKQPQGKFSERTITPKVAMKILEVIPEMYRSTYFADQISPNAKELPGGFAQYFWEAQMAAGADEINDAAYFGNDPDDISDYASGNTYVAGDVVAFVKDSALGKQYFKANAAVATGQTPTTHSAKWDDADAECLAKGWGRIIASEYASLPASNKHAIGQIVESTAVEQFNDLHFSLPEKLRRKTVIHMCSQNSFDAYLQDYEDKYPNDIKVVENNGNIGVALRKTNGKGIIHPVSWMSGAKRIITAPPQTLVAGTDLLSDFRFLGKTVDKLHGYDTIQKAILAFQIADVECLHLTDVA